MGFCSPIQPGSPWSGCPTWTAHLSGRTLAVDGALEGSLGHSEMAYLLEIMAGKSGFLTPSVIHGWLENSTNKHNWGAPACIVFIQSGGWFCDCKARQQNPCWLMIGLLLSSISWDYQVINREWIFTNHQDFEDGEYINLLLHGCICLVCLMLIHTCVYVWIMLVDGLYCFRVCDLCE